MTLSTVIAHTRKAVTDDPAAAQALFSAHATLTGVTEVVVRTAPHAFTVDEPPALGGEGSAPNPVEYALASLGSCQAITYRFWAEHLGISFDTLTVAVDGDLDIRSGCALYAPGQDLCEHVSTGQSHTGKRTPEPLQSQCFAAKASPVANFCKERIGVCLPDRQPDIVGTCHQLGILAQADGDATKPTANARLALA